MACPGSEYAGETNECGGKARMLLSIVIRTLNEAKYLGAALAAISRQQLPAGVDSEVIVVDSGSSDDTLNIARNHQCRIVHIAKADFTFGRSLNMGCDAAFGDILVFLSGHCIPADNHWLPELVEPLLQHKADYSYGRQTGRREVTRFSEEQVFRKNFPDNATDQIGAFFCNNANAAILKDVWRKHRFDETLTGLEDMALAKRVVTAGGKIQYCAASLVEHIHHETWSQIRIRYERESLALRDIMPEVQVNFFDFCRYLTFAVWHDVLTLFSRRRSIALVGEILAYRFQQYWGTYRGHNQHRKISLEQKERYFYPRQTSRTRQRQDTMNEDFGKKNCGVVANEGKQ